MQLWSSRITNDLGFETAFLGKEFIGSRKNSSREFHFVKSSISHSGRTCVPRPVVWNLLSPLGAGVGAPSSWYKSGVPPITLDGLPMWEPCTLHNNPQESV